MLICKFCNKECKNQNSLRNHERLCRINPDRQNTASWTNKNGNLHKSKENQYMRAKRLGIPAPTISKQAREKLSLSNKSRSPEWNKENGRRISETIRKKVQQGTWHTSLAKNMHFEYKGTDLHGTWELKYAMYLDQKSIAWVRNTDTFPYVYDGKQRNYTPDFYLPATDEYVEIKGYKTEKDSAKWSQFPSYKKLKVLMREDLLSLGLDV